MVSSKLRGHDIESVNDIWVYSDTKEPTALHYKERECGNCGKIRTKEGHDDCIGTLAGVINACCGHGVVSEAYVQFFDGSCIRGESAMQIIIRNPGNE